MSKDKAINSLKSLSSVVEIREVVDCVKVLYRSLPSDIEGVMYPKTLEELCKKSSAFFHPNSTIGEINWILSYLRGHWKNISWFAEKKIEFENEFLLGKYTECHELIEEIRSKLGISLWYYEAKCLIYEYEGKAQQGMSFISETLLSCKDNNNYILSLLYNLYERCQKKLSPYKYDEDLNALYKRNRTDLHEDYYKYILFRLNYFNQYSSTDLSLPIMFESLSALVDRYLVLVSVIKSAIIREPGNKDYISKGLYLYNKTKDLSLLSIVSLSGKSVDCYYNAQYVKMLDSYYSGEYDNCRHYAIEIIKSNPACCFDAIVFYSRSLIYLKEDFKIRNYSGHYCKTTFGELTFQNKVLKLDTLYHWSL